MAIAVLLSAPALSQATFPGRNGRVAAVQTDDLGCHYPDLPCASPTALITVRPDGRDRDTLVACDEDCLSGSPAYSPDGAHLAYAIRNALVIARADGRARRVVSLPQGVQPTNPQWSPGGRRLVFVGVTARTFAGYVGDVYVTRIDGTSTQRLTARGTVRVVTWSSRGELALEDDRNVYTGGRAVLSRIMRLDTSTGAVHLLTRGPRSSDHAGSPDWSPDGRRVVFESHEVDGRTSYRGDGIYVLDMRTRRVRRIYRRRPPTANLLRFPVWSPDGSQIAFVEAERVRVARIAGGGVRTVLQQVTGRSVFATVFSRPSWQALPTGPRLTP